LHSGALLVQFRVMRYGLMKRGSSATVAGQYSKINNIQIYLLSLWIVIRIKGDVVEIKRILVFDSDPI